MTIPPRFYQVSESLNNLILRTREEADEDERVVAQLREALASLDQTPGKADDAKWSYVNDEVLGRVQAARHTQLRRLQSNQESSLRPGERQVLNGVPCETTSVQPITGPGKELLDEFDRVIDEIRNYGERYWLAGNQPDQIQR